LLSLGFFFFFFLFVEIFRLPPPLFRDTWSLKECPKKKKKRPKDQLVDPSF
jgi:hypothetical protein